METNMELLNLIDELLKYNESDGPFFSNTAGLYTNIRQIDLNKDYLENKTEIDTILDCNGENNWQKSLSIFNTDGVKNELKTAPMELINNTQEAVFSFCCLLTRMRFQHTHPFIKKTQEDIEKELVDLGSLVGDNKETIEDARFLIELNNNENSYYNGLVGEITGLNVSNFK